MLKKISVIILLMIPILLSAASKKEKATTFTSTCNGVEFTFKIVSTEEKSVEIVYDKKNKYKSPTLTIPSSVDYVGVPFTVVSIGERAFAENGVITKVVLPNTIRTIKANAFSDCSKLEDCKFPEGIVEIDDYAFYDTNVCDFIFPNSLRRIGKEAFLRQLSIKEVSSASTIIPIYLPDEIEEIGENAFQQTFGAGIVKTKTPTYCSMAKIPARYNPRSLAKCGLSVYGNVNANMGGGLLSLSTRQPQMPVQQNNVSLQEMESDKVKETIVSDVDLDIPTNSMKNEKTFVIIIANEDYQSVASVPFAKKDGQTFQSYCEKTLGIPEKNIHVRENATLNNIRSELLWLKQVCDAYEGEASVILYYAGHGVPDEDTHDSYLLPVDGDAMMVQSGLKLSDMYKELSEMNTKLTTVFMDACFSGSVRGNGMLASARGVAIKAKAEAPCGNMVVFSAASGNETAYPYDEKGHGMFTYFLLKSIKETKGGCSLGDLADYITRNVKQQSIVINSKSQTPTISASETVRDWKNSTLK